MLAQCVRAECRGAFAGVGSAEQWHVEPVVATFAGGRVANLRRDLEGGAASLGGRTIGNSILPLFGLLDSDGPAAGDRNRRLALLREARSLFAEGSIYLAEIQAEYPGAIPEDDMKEFNDGLRRCDEAIARLKAA